MSHRAVFLDRDGVINKIVMRDGRPTSPRHIWEFEIEAGVADAVNTLRAGGFKLFVVTNQPELARGLLTDESLSWMTRRIMEALPIDEIRTCPHDNSDGCGCRKPQPGMLLDLARRHDLALGESYIVGDTWKDTVAGRSAGCHSIILDRPYNRDDPADWRVPGIKHAADLICGSAPLKANDYINRGGGNFRGHD
jgi:D-glycero-D-manno-heptose 1,7-bisphosphate phosphatase